MRVDLYEKIKRSLSPAIESSERREIIGDISQTMNACLLGKENSVQQFSDMLRRVALMVMTEEEVADTNTILSIFDDKDTETVVYYLLALFVTLLSPLSAYEKWMKGGEE